MPAGWTQVPDPNVPDAFLVTADVRSNSLYTSNAQLVVYRLVGDFDPKEAITHGYIDSQQLPPGATPTPRWLTSTALRRRSSKAPTGRTR